MLSAGKAYYYNVLNIPCVPGLVLHLSEWYCWLMLTWFGCTTIITSKWPNGIKTPDHTSGIRWRQMNNVNHDVVRCPARNRPMFSYTDAGRRPYDMWPRISKFLKIVRCPGDYQIRRWCANRWNRTMSVLFVTVALSILHQHSANILYILLMKSSID